MTKQTDARPQARPHPFAPGAIQRFPSRRAETRFYTFAWAVFRLFAVCLLLGLLAGLVTGWGQNKGWW